MKNKDKDIVKNAYIDLRYKQKFFYGYAFYAYGTSIKLDKIECYDSTEWDDSEQCYLNDKYMLDIVKEVITSFLNLNNKKVYDYNTPIYSKYDFELFLSPIEE